MIVIFLWLSLSSSSSSSSSSSLSSSSSYLFTFQWCLLSRSPLSQYLILFLLTFVSEMVLLSRLLTSLRPQVSQKIRHICLPLRPDQADLLYICVGVIGTSDQLLYAQGWWLSLLELPGVQVSWDCWCSCGVDFPFSFFNFSSNWTIGFPDFSPMFGCKYFHLSQAAAIGASQGIAMLGSCL